MRLKFISLLFIFLNSFHLYGKSIESLKFQINSILESKQATVGVAISSMNTKESLAINGDLRLPMQSVYKYHLAIAVLNEIDKGNMSLLDKITITPEDLDNGLWSLIRKKYPKGITLSLAEVVKYTVAYSDNVGCDILFRMLGGTVVVEKYFHQLGVNDISIIYDEATQQRVWGRQFENWTTAKAANKVLKLFYENKTKLLSPESHRFLWDIMKASGTGKKTIKGYLNKETVVAHKTGHSGKNKLGVTGAQNDIGIVFLPNGTYFYLSVLVSNSTESRVVNKKIIADIAKLAWDYFESRTQ